jgi:putative addiction module component (TIGR02574 family)
MRKSTSAVLPSLPATRDLSGETVLVAMNPKLANVLAAAELLSAEERRELVDLLLGGLDDPGETNGETLTLSDAWGQEVARRSAEYDAGQTETVSWQEVQARWQSRRSADECLQQDSD